MTSFKGLTKRSTEASAASGDLLEMQILGHLHRLKGSEALWDTVGGSGQGAWHSIPVLISPPRDPEAQSHQRTTSWKTGCILESPVQLFKNIYIGARNLS